MKFIIIKLIQFYQNHLRKFHNRECIYTPTCSHYMIQAINKYGVVKGIYFGLLRIRRCNGALYQGCEDYP